MATRIPERPRPGNRSRLLCEGVSCPATSDAALWLCVPCSSTYCDICWDRQGPHKPGKIALDPRLHEKTNKDVYDRLQSVFDPPAKNATLEERTATLWFGAKPSQAVDQSVHESSFETRRFSELKTQTSTPQTPGRARFLVSFLGQAGSGMSTIVRLLLASTRAGLVRAAPSQESAEYDVLSGIHLFAGLEEPMGFPLLYADCKGLVDPAIEAAASISPTQSPRPTRRRFSSIFGSVPREPSRSSVELPQSSPQWIMSNVYSHLMYTVSDVVVLVIPHSRALEITTLTWLLSLASKSLDFSFEQILLPRAIIVLNGSPQDTGTWNDVERVTTNFLSDFNMYWNDSRLAKYLSPFKKQSKPVSSIADLLNSYYSVIRVVKLPKQERIMLFQEQTSVLHSEILNACAAVYEYEISIKEVKDAAQLHSLIKDAFNHFTTRLGQPFRRVPLQFRVDPITPDFKHHIVTLARAVSGRYASGVYLSDFQIFLAIAPVVASCIFTHCIRYGRPGSPASVFGHVFGPSCASALQMFIRQHTNCQYQYQQLNATLHCIINKADHVNGHRMSNDTVREGKFIPSNSFDSSAWLNTIMECLVTIENHLRTVTRSSSICMNRTPNFLAEVHALHRKTLGRFFQGFATNVGSRFSCFGCLMEIPQFPFACSHFICTDCVKMFGNMSEPGVVVLGSCPLDANSASGFLPCSIHVGTEPVPATPSRREMVQIRIGGGGAGSA